MRVGSTGRDALVLRAVETERALLADVAARLGITSGRTREALTEAEALVDATSRSRTRSPRCCGASLRFSEPQRAPAELVAEVIRPGPLHGEQGLPFPHTERATAGLQAQLREQALAAGCRVDWSSLTVTGPTTSSDAQGNEWFNYSGTAHGRS